MQFPHKHHQKDYLLEIQFMSLLFFLFIDIFGYNRKVPQPLNCIKST